MHVEIQTKRLGVTVFLVSLTSFFAIFLCTAIMTRQNLTAQGSSGFQIYTYQNPFDLPKYNPTPAVNRNDGLLSKLTSAQFILGVSSLGVLWFASALILRGERKVKKPAHREIIPILNPEPKMNPLAILPRANARVHNQDNFGESVFCEKTTAVCSQARRKIAVPCQSRFRPVILASRQSRFGRL